jgi:hypothetical protein
MEYMVVMATIVALLYALACTYALPHLRPMTSYTHTSHLAVPENICNEPMSTTPSGVDFAREAK